jgi:hypothetical protein
MPVRLLTAAVISLAICPILCGQRVDATNTHFRVWAVDSVTVTIDAKTKTKTIAPAHASASGMLGYAVIYHPTDPNICLVEYVHKQYHGLDAVRQAVAVPGVDARLAVFEKGSTSKAAVTAAAKALGFPSIDFNKFAARVP